MIKNFKDAGKELLYIQEKEDEYKCQHFFSQMQRLASEVFVEQVTYIIGKACESNSLPQESVEIIHIPIPKKANRIMSCLKEHTSILWSEQKTQSITKGKGVKQECPLLPWLFTIVLDDVLRPLEELVSETARPGEGSLKIGKSSGGVHGHIYLQSFLVFLVFLVSSTERLSGSPAPDATFHSLFSSSLFRRWCFYDSLRLAACE
ncbi:hypothetical protein EVAR_56546_1 [Eumeta japonica]|uniref:Uncharacterized protein n=1 Tax=Eumeta variegata TaxID=151549 RepID=A0A4C1YYS5_EUMVA|nr:hypothetical protein EVAR_56546_1 [Eumeta japonica]